MTLALVALSILFTVYMIFLALSPLLGKDDSGRADLLGEELRQSEELSSLKALYMANLHEIEIDRDLEKITEEDYRQLKRENESRAVKVMRELDTLHGGRGWQQRIDEAVLERRGLAAPMLEAKEKVEPVAPLEEEEAHVADVDADAAATADACPACGYESNDPDARFCSRCGKPMNTHRVAVEDEAATRREVN